ncbi:hypothetical protein BC629DRAFT_1523301 [Irpex lacteus]|nr:hypothetical protein BC629DRAFT_1523301 [Irpex lacteus]
MVAASTLSHPSQCKAKALLIALSYENRDGVENLSTTHADQDRLAQHLVDFWGYCPECIIKMRDGSDDVMMRPTRKNIVSTSCWQSKDIIFRFFRVVRINRT